MLFTVLETDIHFMFIKYNKEDLEYDIKVGGINLEHQ